MDNVAGSGAPLPCIHHSVTRIQPPLLSLSSMTTKRMCYCYRLPGSMDNPVLIIDAQQRSILCIGRRVYKHCQADNQHQQPSSLGVTIHTISPSSSKHLPPSLTRFDIFFYGRISPPEEPLDYQSTRDVAGRRHRRPSLPNGLLLDKLLRWIPQNLLPGRRVLLRSLQLKLMQLIQCHLHFYNPNSTIHGFLLPQNCHHHRHQRLQAHL